MGIKKSFLFISSLILFVIIMYIFIGGEISRKTIYPYEYNLVNADILPCAAISQNFIPVEKNLNSIELAFDAAESKNPGAVIFSIYDNNEILIYRTSILIKNIKNRAWNKIFVNAQLESDKEYKITLECDDQCTEIPKVLTVSNGASSSAVKSFQDNLELESQVAVRYGYLSDPSLIDKFVISSLWILLFIIINILFINIYNYKDRIALIWNRTGEINKQLIISVSEIFLFFIILGCSGIEFQSSTKIILGIITVLSAWKFQNKYNFVKGFTDTKSKKIILILLYLFASFSLVGQRILIYPLNKTISISGLLVFFCAFLWFIPVINSFIYSFDILSGICTNHSEKMKLWKFIFLILLILILPAAYNLYAYNPGISTVDTGRSILENAKHLHGMFDWHPFFYCLVLRVILEIWDSTYAVILVQYIFYSYVILELILYLKKKGIREDILIIFACLTGINASNYIQINTIWKDIPYTLSLLWAFTLIAKLTLDKKEYKGKWFIYFEVIVSFTGIFLYRKNGAVTLIVMILFLLPVIKNNLKFLVSIFLSFIVIFIVNGPLYKYFEVVNPGNYGMYIGLGQDVLGVYYAGGEVTEDTLKMITMMTNYNNSGYSYKPTWSNASYEVDISPVSFVKNYISTFVRNPIVMIRAVIAREDALWNIFPGEGSFLGCVNATGTLDNNKRIPDWNDYYPPRVFVSLYNTAQSINSYIENNQWISALVWRCGAITLSSLVVIVFLLIKNKNLANIMILLSPVLGHSLGLILSTGWSDFRYFWPLNLINLSFIFLSLDLISKKDENLSL